MNAPKTVLTALLVLGLTSACDDQGAEFDATSDSDFRSSRLTPINFEACPPHLCGVNAGVAGAMSFHLDGDDSLDGQILFEVLDDMGLPIDIHINGTELYAINGEGEGLQGHDLEGSRFLIRDMDTNEVTTIYLDEYLPQEAESIRSPGVFYSAYEFTFHHEDDDPELRTPLCGATPWNDENTGIDPDTTAAIVVQNEAFDWWGNSVADLDTDPDYAANWFTIGCSGGAFAKKVLLGYDMSQPSGQGQRPTHVENVTMMHMLTARYCGGENHTMTGVDLYWQNDRGEFPVPAGLEVEAVWDEHGAVCLNTPRFAMREDIETECGAIPTCAGINPADYHLVSYNLGEAPGAGASGV